MELAPLTGHRDRVLLEREASPAIGFLGLEHPIARLLRSTRLGDDDRERLVQALADGAERAIDAVRVGIVEEERTHRIAVRHERRSNEFRSEGRAANTDHQKILEPRRALGDDRSLVHIGRKLHDACVRRCDGISNLRARREGRVTQPIVADHAVLVGVGDRPFFELVHRAERSLDWPVHAIEEAIVEPHPTDVDGQIDRRAHRQVLSVPTPQRACFAHVAT
jgi:hypothetical protein